MTVAYLLHLLAPAERGLVLREVARVLAPGGRAVTVTIDCRRTPVARLLRALPRWSGLKGLDASGKLLSAGLRPLRTRFVIAGWPSQCVLAEQRAP